jgi:hypothetical protein
MCKECTPERFTDSRRSLKVVEHLGGRVVQGKAQREETKSLEIL